ncbi:MAG: IS5 family transposase [Rhodopila sp.]
MEDCLSIVSLLGLPLRVADHTILSRRTARLEVPQPQRHPGAHAEALHLLVDSTGLKLCGAGAWLVENHGTKTCRSWRKRRIGVEANTGRIMASALTTKEADDGTQVGPLLEQIIDPLTSFMGDGASDQDGVYDAVADHHPEAAVIVPPRAIAMPSPRADTAPTQRDGHLRCIAETGRRAWQTIPGYNRRAKVEAATGRWKQVIVDGLRSCRDDRRATEVEVAVYVLNRMLEPGRSAMSASLDHKMR